MKNLGGRVLFIDRNDINTDEIIPARYLNEDSREALRPYCFEDLALQGFERGRDLPGKGVVLSRANFGCGSSREHAPWALEMNGINVVVAESFARIFRRNMFNCGMVAVELPGNALEELFGRFAGRETTMVFDLEGRTMSFFSPGTDGAVTLPFSLGDFEVAMIKAGGWVPFAAEKY